MSDYSDMIMASDEFKEKLKHYRGVLRSVYIPNYFTTFPFTQEEEKEIYERCVASHCLWQDLPDVVKRVKAWDKECKKLLAEGAVF